MKIIFLYSFLFLSFLISAQNDVIHILREKQKSSPTDVIIFADSLLGHNNNFSQKTIQKIKYEEALAYQNNNDHKKALQIFNKLSSKLNKNDPLFIKTLLLQSNSNVYLKNYTTAINQALEALTLAKMNNYYNLIFASNNALSFIYYSNKDYKKAFDYLSNSVMLQREQNDSIQLSATYNNIAIIYKNIGDFKKAINYNQKSLEISFLKKDNIGIGKSYSNIGRVYELKGDYKKAIFFYKKAIYNNHKFQIINSIPYRNIAEIYTRLGNFDEAKKNYLKALKIEKKNNNLSKVYTIYKDLLKNAINKKKFQNALTYQAKSDSIYNIIITKENRKKIKILENEQIYFKNKKELLQLKKINFKNNIIFGILISFLILLGLFWFQITKRKELENEKEKLELEQSVLRSQMNPHFIFNTLSAIQNTLLDDEPIKSAIYISKFATLIRQNFDFVNKKTIKLSEEIDALKNYMDTQKLRFNNKFDYKINIDNTINSSKIEIPPLLIQPFIENAIEHGFRNKKEKGTIIINISKKQNYICYEIIDNGKGYSITKKNNNTQHAIDIFIKRIKLLATNDEKSFLITSSTKGTIIKFKLKQ
ncbi:MAG TPA: tetratricopeptide repeat protein [Flavobacteriia bacterium]|nr:tetratricopeptide repeat protein [Flavobacteriia bacterium]